MADSTGNTIVSQQVTNTSGNLSLASLKEGALYTISVGAIPVNGTVDNARWTHLQFALKGTPTPTPTAVPTPTPTPAPGEVGIPTVSITPVESVSVDMIHYVSAGTLTVGWSAGGDVDHYLVQVFDGMGQVLASQEFTATTTTLGTRAMREGEVYTLRVTAVPVNGTVEDDAASPRTCASPSRPRSRPRRRRPCRPTEAPRSAHEAPTEAPTEAPPKCSTLHAEATEPPIGTVNAPVISIDPSAEQDGVYYVDSDFTISWSAEGDVAGYHLRVASGDTVFLDNAVTDESLAVPLTNLGDGAVTL